MVSPGIRKMKVISVAYVYPILFSIYLNIHRCLSKFSQDDFDLPKWWKFLTYDGFKYHVNSTDALEISAEERIKVGK